jgi:predicted HAD superfamily Cof-like phosphohydrolase
MSEFDPDMTVFDDVMEFQRAMDLAVGDFAKPDITRDQAMRVRLIEEEVTELIDALASGDLNGVADALADIQYVVNGAAIVWGINLDNVHAEVHRSNMTKRGGTLREDGKLLKPEGYEPPQIERVLAEQVKKARGVS